MVQGPQTPYLNTGETQITGLAFTRHFTIGNDDCLGPTLKQVVITRQSLNTYFFLSLT